MRVSSDRESDGRSTVLAEFGRALSREAHVLAERPESLWQQLHNRLQWEEDPVPWLIEPQMYRRSAPGATPWLRTKTPLRESQALRLTLAGHTGWVEACAISPDSDFVVTASADGTCKIWDRTTGEERTTLTGHIDWVTARAISPDSDFVVTVSQNKTCKIWDAATGQERASLPLSGEGRCVALHPWQPFAACGDSGGGVYLIDLVGIEYGPIIVTAVDLGKGTEPALRCPKCFQSHPLDDAWLGEVIECPTPSCGLSLRVNPFVTRMAMRRH